MPVTRGTVYILNGAGPETVGVVAITHDTWNAHLSQVGCVPVRASVLESETPYALPVSSGGYASAARIVSLLAPGQAGSQIGPAVDVLPREELGALEERLCAFLQLPALLTGRSILKGIASSKPYPLWSNVYYGPEAEGERKRYVIMSPNPWNALSGLAMGIRTTTAFKRNHVEFLLLASVRARACCGDATTLGARHFLLDPRSRPAPSLVSGADMVAIARGLISVYELDAALGRLGVPSPQTS